MLAAGLPLPKTIVAHGWLLFEESKMSKSRGNIVRTETILDVLGADALRYFLLREVVFGQDGSFSFDALVQRYNSDLANGLGNLASRTLTMINRYFKGEVPYPSHSASRLPSDDAIVETARRTIQEFGTLFDQFQFSRALETAWGLIAAVDKYIVENEPWSLGEKQDDESRARLATVLYTSAEALRIATALAHPVMPDATAKIWAQMGLGDIQKLALSDLAWGQLPLGTKLGAVHPVFPRADKSAIERMQQMEDQQRGPAVEEAKEAKEPAKQSPVTQAAANAPAAVTAPVPPATADGKITIDDFAKIELRVGVVKVAERVPKADKLLRLEIDIGTEVRQVLAGIAEAYAPETLIGRKVVIVANLAPRKLRGLESNGMIVAASLEGGKPVLFTVVIFVGQLLNKGFITLKLGNLAPGSHGDLESTTFDFGGHRLRRQSAGLRPAPAPSDWKLADSTLYSRNMPALVFSLMVMALNHVLLCTPLNAFPLISTDCF